MKVGRLPDEQFAVYYEMLQPTFWCKEEKMREVTDADIKRAESLAKVAIEKEKAHYKEIADKINNEDGFLQKSWNLIVAKGLFNIPLVTPKLVEKVAVSGSLPRLDLTNLKGPTGIIAFEALLGSGIGIAALVTILAGAGIAIPIVGVGAAGVSAVLLYKAVRFRHEHETEIENLIKTALYSKASVMREQDAVRRADKEVIIEMDAYRKAESLFAGHGFIQQGKVFSAMLTQLHNIAVTQRSSEKKYAEDDQSNWDEEQKKALFVMRYLEDKGVIKRKHKRDGYFEPGENFIISQRKGQEQFDESEQVSSRIQDYIDAAIKAYAEDKKRKKHS